MTCDDTILNLQAQKVPIFIEYGDTFKFTLTFTNDSGTAIDMSTILDAEFVVNDEIVAELGDGITVTGASDNVLSLFAQNEYDAGRYKYKYTVTYADGQTRTIIDGPLTVTTI